jgi:excisionase family DNA binding protein
VAPKYQLTPKRIAQYGDTYVPVFMAISNEEFSMAKQRKKKPAPATMTVEEVAKRLRIGRNQAYEAVHDGKIPAIRIGTRWLVPTAALDRLLLSGKAA